MSDSPHQPSQNKRVEFEKWSRHYFSAGISHEMWPKAVEHAFEAGWNAARKAEHSEPAKETP